MMRQYLKTSIRYLVENKTFSMINVLGLSIALCVIYFTLLFVGFELSYDNFHEKGDQIYRLSTDVTTQTGVNYETSSAPMAEAMQASFPEIEDVTRIFLDNYIVQNQEDEHYGDERLAYADESFFSFFSFPLVRGNAATAFSAPYNMVITETAAKKYFGTTDCLNKTLTLDGHIQASITGVMKDMPSNSHFKVDMFLSMSSLVKDRTKWTDWRQFGFSTYLLLKQGTDIHELQKKLPAFAQAHPFKDKISYSLVLEPLTQVYLHGKLRNNKAGSTAVGSYKNVYIFSIIAVFVLFIASFNFINLSTALSLKRAKEIGVRKVMGASRMQLIVQFLIDAIVVSVFACIGAILIIFLVMPWFNALTGKLIIPGMIEQIQSFGWLFLVAIFIGILSGIYPAFFLSGGQAVISLKGKYLNSTKGVVLRRALVTMQFLVFTVLTIATLVVYQQLDFMQNEKLGFKKAHHLVVDFHYDDRIRDHFENIESQFLGLAEVQSASVSSAVPGRPNKKFPVLIEDTLQGTQAFQWDSYFVDYEFLDQYGIELVAGRGFSKAFSNDFRGNVILNEAAVKAMGFQEPSEVIGKRALGRGNEGYVIGVIKDFQYQSLREEIKPLAIQISPSFFTFLTLEIVSEHLPSAIKKIEKHWASVAPGLPFVYSFSDEGFNAQYVSESRFGKLFVCFSFLAIFISSMGLLGLVSFTTWQRTKEIGVRKILGASFSSIAKLLTREYVSLILIAVLMATPIAWWAMTKWLQDFAYRIDMEWWMFGMAGGMAVAIALFTVSIQVIKAALANPADSLRDE